MLRILTKEQAIEEYSEQEGYEWESEFTYLVVGTRAEVRKAITVHQNTTVYCLDPETGANRILRSIDTDRVEDEAIQVANEGADFEVGGDAQEYLCPV